MRLPWACKHEKILQSLGTCAESSSRNPVRSIPSDPQQKVNHRLVSFKLISFTNIDQGLQTICFSKQLRLSILCSWEPALVQFCDTRVDVRIRDEQSLDDDNKSELKKQKKSSKTFSLIFVNHSSRDLLQIF